MVCSHGGQSRWSKFPFSKQGIINLRLYDHLGLRVGELPDDGFGGSPARGEEDLG